MDSTESSDYAITNRKLFLKVSIDGRSEKHMVKKLLSQVSVQEIHNSLVIPPEEGGLKKARDK